MRIRFIKTHTGSYGTFPEGRECELPPTMLKTIPEDCYEEVLPEEGEGEAEQTQPEESETESQGQNE